MLRTAESERLVLLTVNRWKADTFVNPKLAYDMKLRIFNQAGDLLLDKTFRDERKLRGLSWTPMGVARKIVPIAFEKAIRDMLEDEEVAVALTADSPPVIQAFADIPADQAPILWDLAF